MPHQCTDCGRSFADGSTEMLSGCPDCGGTTFQYTPEGTESPEQPSDEPPEPPESPADSSVARTVGSAATAVRDLVGGSPGGADTGLDSEPDGETVSAPAAPETPPEDPAQASARNDVVAPEDLPPASESGVTERPTPVLDEDSESAGAGVETADAAEQERPDLQTLREELNDQFESIKVVEPGQYELNLMELYDREEYIIALQEDGKYTIQVPERWTGE
jgi:predicted  nucleic acid-binding Zn-ribbon protein